MNFNFLETIEIYEKLLSETKQTLEIRELEIELLKEENTLLKDIIKEIRTHSVKSKEKEKGE